MKYNIKRMLLPIFWIVLGATLLLCSIFDVVDSFWSGMGGAFIAVGIVQLIRNIRYSTNEEYRENIDIQSKDERNRYLSMKAWSWAGYLSVITGAIGTIGFKVAGKDELSTFCGFMVCIIILFYWISYLIVRKKY